MESPNRRRSASFNSLVMKTVVPDAIISPTIAHRKDYCSSSHTNASSMLNQNVPKTPRSYTQFTYEPSYSQMLVHSGLLQHVRHRHISENRALATWLSLMIIKGKLVLDDPGIVLDELELLHGLTYHLTKSFQVLNPPTAVVLVAFLYFCRIFPKEVRYSGNPDDECSIALARLFLLCLRLAAQWFEDQCEFFDFRGRRFQWFEYLGLTKVVFRNADIQTLLLLDHNLCVSNVSYAHWLSHLLSSLPEYLGNYPEERCAISQLIHAIRPTLTAAFLHADRLQCPGLPFNKEWRPPLCFSAGEFEERGTDLVDCVTFGLAIPLPVAQVGGHR
ncbi:hypothetical protein BT96DRAFT_1016442 [Gymnopus androsaceus JB14]|uniref:Uncharacterized protein n=1 Tax=Gymnopus androsaceus JB14 TaxID=1447944 RepID=A0A6A4I0F3_9AGAR|nr:hypothetical protein BT96DRAFT_1016442 [Gymnopus androsaceus JB14]